MESFYKNWLKQNQKENSDARRAQITNLPPSSTNNTPNISVTDGPVTEGPSTNSVSTDDSVNSVPVRNSRTDSNVLHTVDFDSLLPTIIFEDDNLQLIIEKGNHIKQKKFRLEDHIFYMKIKLKNNSDAPLLRDILSFLETGFDYIISQIRTFYKSEDHNIAYLTLYQKPMINGLNTGGFDIQDSGTDIVDRVLKMLEQFLISNQTLKVDETFKVYLKVLSIPHIKFKQNDRKRVHRKRTKEFYKRKKTYGSRRKPTKKFNYFWAVDIPTDFKNAAIYLNTFKDKCLLTSTILGLLQHIYFESNRKDRRYLYAQNINSTDLAKQIHAGNIILSELNKLITNLQLPENGPYDIEETAKKLSIYFNCQFFIFDGIHNSKKLIFMYPEQFQDDLKPIYLLQPIDAKDHLVFIRNYHSYCRANVKICFGCKKTFSSYNYKHLCPQRQCCFSCRRFFQGSNTYLNEKLIPEFCNKNVTLESSFICELCNVTCYSNHCYKGHKLHCNGQGTFGYKCLKCNKFMYRHGKMNGKNLKLNHYCGELKSCPYCRELKDINHQCKLKKEVFAKNWPKLAFIGMEHFENLTENNTENNDPVIAIIYAEEDSFGNFTKYEFHNFQDHSIVSKTPSYFMYTYLPEYCKNIAFNSQGIQRKTKITQDFKTNYNSLQNSHQQNLMDNLLQHITSPQWANTTFICQDEDSLTLVNQIKG